MEITVDINALRQNIIRLKAAIQDAAFYFMVKGDAYNHGLEQCVINTQDIVDGYGVATCLEGQRIRELCVSKPIIVSCPTLKDINLARVNNLILEVGNFTILSNIKPYTTIDIKVDTGMHRQGFFYSDIDRVIRHCAKHHLIIRGLSTHFMSKECAYLQMCRFYDILDIFAANKIHPVLHYIATPTLDSGLLTGDFVRIGIGAYGYEHRDVIPVLTATSNIINIKRVKKGDSLGYGGAYVVDKDTNIALVGGGYYDGIHRAYSGSRVFIEGRLYPIVGRVNMDSFFVDLGKDDYKVGDYVEIVGKNNPADIFANSVGTISYEVLTGLKGDRWVRNYSL